MSGGKKLKAIQCMEIDKVQVLNFFKGQFSDPMVNNQPFLREGKRKIGSLLYTPLNFMKEKVLKLGGLAVINGLNLFNSLLLILHLLKELSIVF